MMCYKGKLYGICMQQRAGQQNTGVERKASRVPAEPWFKVQKFVLDNNAFALLLAFGKGMYVVSGSQLRSLPLTSGTVRVESPGSLFLPAVALNSGSVLNPALPTTNRMRVDTPCSWEWVTDADCQHLCLQE